MLNTKNNTFVDPIRRIHFQNIGGTKVLVNREGDFIKLRDYCKDIEINLTYTYQDGMFSACFKNKNRQAYSPESSNFSAKSLDLLIQHIEIELRNMTFTKFVGIKTKKAIVKNLHTNKKTVFERIKFF